MAKKSSNAQVKLRKKKGNPDDAPSLSLPGYAVTQSPGGERVHVPHFMVPDASMKMLSQRQQQDLNVAGRSGGPLPRTHIPYIALAGGSLHLPADPPITDREALKVHADIAALQEVHGISYKDASNRLYYSTLEGLRAEDGALREISRIRQQMQRTLATEIYRPLIHMDNYHISSVRRQREEAVAGRNPQDGDSHEQESDETDENQQSDVDDDEVEDGQYAQE